ncbi:PKD domain-containing protein [Halomicrobium salinisoli]|uniref:PKD domain-containing protein n=1 Tax=Halomicrobium salinisoli TaxID=2878391 RepID=UPI001CEFF599|nr:PKD domain-containing protein [Halomicrobium salinisoli]
MVADRYRSLLLAALLVASVAVVPAPASADSDGVGVTQNGECYAVDAYGDGSETVEEFYDYRSGTGTKFASYGTTHLQRSQTSQLFVYDGSQGLSLVIVHDELNDGDGGGTTTFDMYGLPSDGEWAVRDDYYGEDTDDDWVLEGSEAHVDWKWAPNRTDGGAYRGLDGNYDEIVIKPGFNEDADHYPTWPWYYDRTEEWLLRTSPSDTVSLSMNDSVAITHSCAPTAALSVSGDAQVDESVTLDASGSSDDGGITEYRWDVDGDGSVEATTGSATYEHAYESSGSFEPSVTVVDGDGRTDTASATVSVEETTETTTVEEAVASYGPGDDSRIEAQELQLAIHWWQTDATVPGTDGETISAKELQELIYMWQNGTAVDG